jgi:hypothetical protein
MRLLNRLVTAPIGGGNMAVPSEWLIAPRQVWTQVPDELKRRTITVMAHLAMNLVVASAPQTIEEESDAEANASSQTPP